MEEAFNFSYDLNLFQTLMRIPVSQYAEHFIFQVSRHAEMIISLSYSLLKILLHLMFLSTTQGNASTITCTTEKDTGMKMKGQHLLRKANT